MKAIIEMLKTLWKHLGNIADSLAISDGILDGLTELAPSPFTTSLNDHAAFAIIGGAVVILAIGLIRNKWSDFFGRTIRQVRWYSPNKDNRHG